MATDSELGRLSKQWNRLFAMAGSGERNYEFLRQGLQSLIEGRAMPSDQCPQNEMDGFEELVISLLDDPVRPTSHRSASRMPLDTATIMFVASGGGQIAATIVAEAFPKLDDEALVAATAVFIEQLLRYYRVKKGTEPFTNIIRDVLEQMTWENPLSGSPLRDLLDSDLLPVEFRIPLADAAAKVLTEQREEQVTAQRAAETRR